MQIKDLLGVKKSKNESLKNCACLSEASSQF
jgi:hypothetical protein